MSSLWTPGGERPVRPASSEASQGQDQRRDRGPSGGVGGAGGAGAARGPGGEEALTEDEARQMAELRERMDQLAATPAEIVVANHAYGLSQLAALHLSLDRPQLDQARLAIDAFGYLVEGLGDRLGEPAADLREALSQLRMAFVQIRAAVEAAGAAGGAGTAGEGGPGAGGEGTGAGGGGTAAGAEPPAGPAAEG